MNEAAFLPWIRGRFASSDSSVLVGAGPDDCAIVSTEGISRLAITTDTIVEGTHFEADADPFAIGWKAVAVNLSDLAASGCRPRWGVVALTLRRGRSEAWIQALVEGMATCAEEYHLTMIGGDTNSGDLPTSLTITAIGTPYGKAPLLRKGAQVDDVLVVTGALGGSLLGRHLHPLPRLAEIDMILHLASKAEDSRSDKERRSEKSANPEKETYEKREPAEVGIHAAIDISDGLALDLTRMMEESGRGAVIEEEKIPVHPDARRRSEQTGHPPLFHALSDGEDFELLLALTPSTWKRIHARWPREGLAPLTAIGVVKEEAGLYLRGKDGSCTRLPPLGYLHELS